MREFRSQAPFANSFFKFRINIVSIVFRYTLYSVSYPQIKSETIRRSCSPTSNKDSCPQSVYNLRGPDLFLIKYKNV